MHQPQAYIIVLLWAGQRTGLQLIAPWQKQTLQTDQQAIE
jgi:hypothetical protein